MRKFCLVVTLLFFTASISCEKDETPKLKSVPKEDLKQCIGCSGTWDLSDIKS